MPLGKEGKKVGAAVVPPKKVVKPIENASVTEAKASQTPAEVAVLGTKSGTVELVRTVGTRAKTDTVQRMVNGVAEKVGMPYVIGFIWRALEDMIVPDCGTTLNLKRSLMDYKDARGTKAVKKGEEFLLTRFETGAMLCTPEFNGTASGGPYTAKCVYQLKKDSSPGVMQSKSEPPSIQVKIIDGASSIKDVPQEIAVDFTEVVEEGGKKNRTLFLTDETKYAKFAPLTQKAERRTTGGSGRVKAEATYNKNASAFAAYYERAKAEAGSKQ